MARRRGYRWGWILCACAILASMIASVGPARRSLAATSCGKERWDVKTGTDAGAAGTDLALPVPTTIADLVAKAPPPAWSNTLPRLEPVETTVWVVTGFVTEYAREDDSDYHVVIADSAGRTMIVELPSPSCVGPGSPFAPRIAVARGEFDARLTATGSFKAPPVRTPVQVTGVGFFDKLHHQNGLAPNGIELHPVLDIQFDPSPAPALTELLADGGFEGSPGPDPTPPPWAGSTNLALHPVLMPAGPLPHAGTGYARLGERNGAVDVVSQSVTIPAGAAGPALTFWAGVQTNERGDAGPDDRLDVEVRSDQGVLLGTPATLTNRDATPAGEYAQRGPFDLSAFAGRTVQLVFRATTDDALATAFRVDDASLAARIPKADRADVPPATAVVAPADQATLSGVVSVHATSSDGGTVSRTEVYADGALLAIASGPSVSAEWDTATVTNGPHTLVSKAIDGQGRAWSGQPVTVTVSNAGAAQILLDPGFEGGDVWQATAGVVTASTLRQPRSGGRYAWLDGYGRPHSDRLTQTVSIPGSATGARLSFWLHIDTAEPGPGVADTLHVDLLGPSGVVLSRLITYTNLGAAPGYFRKDFDVSAFRGQTVVVAFTGTEDGQRETSFVLDDVSLEA
jgi:hypothetical protein